MVRFAENLAPSSTRARKRGSRPRPPHTADRWARIGLSGSQISRTARTRRDRSQRPGRHLEVAGIEDA